MSFHFEYFLRPIDEVFPIATDFPGVIPRIVFVLRHIVASTLQLSIIHATLVNVGLVQQDAQFVLFPFALTIAHRISLAGRRLYDRSL